MPLGIPGVLTHMLTDDECLSLDLSVAGNS